MTKPELTNRRDLTYNIWHRKLGNKIYALDIDLMEYDNQGNPLALIETKKWGYSISDFQKMCFIKTAELLGVPFFCVQYTQDLTKYFVEPFNEKALQYIDEAKQVTEKDWIKILYNLHKIKITEDELDKLVTGDNNLW